MKKTIIGHIVCPVCPHTDAEVKEDKNGHAYAHCPDCNAQIFTRNTHRDTNLRKKMRAVTVTVTEPKPEPVPAAPTVTNTPPAQRHASPVAAKKTLPGVKAAPPPPQKKASSWFSPILAVGGGDD